MTRQSSNYHGDLWPLPGQSAQYPRPLSFHAPLVSRPKSTESAKVERSASISPRSDQNLSNPSAAMSSFEYLRSRSGLTPEQIGIQTALHPDFSNIPVSQQYTAENGIGTWTGSLTARNSPVSFAELSSEPSSARSNVVYFPEPMTSNFQLQVVDIPLNEPTQFSQDQSGVLQTSPHQMPDGLPSVSTQQNYNICPTPMSEHQPQYSAIPLSPPQAQTSTIQSPFPPCYTLSDNPIQYYSTVPDWYIKPEEESWPGSLPSERMNDFYWSC